MHSRRQACRQAAAVVENVSKARHMATAPSVLMFPGQGAQKPGMGKDLHADFKSARLIFEEVEDALQEKLTKAMFEGNETDLAMTAVTQPAILAHSVAVFAALQEACGDVITSRCTSILGHSVGEYPALVAAGCLSLADAARLLRVRGRSMQEAADKASKGQSEVLGMQALILTAPSSTASPRTRQQKATSVGQQKASFSTAAGASASARSADEAGSSRAAPAPVSPLMATVAELDAACAAITAASNGNEVASIAAINSPNQIVLSGHSSAMQKVVATVQQSSASGGTRLVIRRAVKLPVSAPFHSPIMQPAAEAVRTALNGDEQRGIKPIALRKPKFPLISNVTAGPVDDTEEIKRVLVAGICTPVRWHDCVQAATRHHQSIQSAQPMSFMELGPGSTLSAFVKAILPGTTAAGSGGGGKDAEAGGGQSAAAALDVRSLGTTAEIREFLKLLEKNHR